MAAESLPQRLRRIFEIDPAAGAIEFEGDWWSWGDLRRVVDALNDILSKANVGEGAAVGVMLRNRPAQVSALLTLLTSHRCVVTINPILPQKRLLDDVEQLKLEALIADSEDWQIPGLKELAARQGTLGIEILRQKGAAPRLVAGLEKIGPQTHRPKAPEIAVELLTSGTTGPPKRVKLGFQNLQTAIEAAAPPPKEGAGELKLKRSATLLYTPLVHISGLYFSIFSVFEGRPMVLHERFDPHKWSDAVKRHQLKAAGLVPTAMRMVLDSDISKDDLKSLIVVRSGTAPLDPDTADAFTSRFGIPVLPTYGATEFAGSVAGWTAEMHKEFWKKKRGSSGRPVPGCVLRIIDAETGADLGNNKVGILEVKSDQVGPDWVRTADLALIDDDGFLFVKGRADNAIIRGGFKIMPGDVADVIKQYPGVRDAGVIGLKDARLGEIPVAAIEKTPGAKPFTEDELKAFLKERLKPYEIPARILIVDKLPRTPSLKISQLGVKDLFEPA